MVHLDIRVAHFRDNYTFVIYVFVLLKVETGCHVVTNGCKALWE